jgi:hypothetical protein
VVNSEEGLTQELVEQFVESEAMSLGKSLRYKIVLE